jgi:hypothetical protein
MLFKLIENQKNTYPKYCRTNQKSQKQPKYKYETKKNSFLFLILASLYLAVQTFILDPTIHPNTIHTNYSNEDLNYIPMARPTPTPKLTRACKLSK